ncbi:hypothetical protein DPMN_034096, partial [Dreissena polymorpha]
MRLRFSELSISEAKPITIFKLSPDIIKTNVLTKLHEDWAKYMTSRVLTRKMPSHRRPCKKILTKKNALPPGGH